jgi:hypothetical protein
MITRATKRGRGQGGGGGVAARALPGGGGDADAPVLSGGGGGGDEPLATAPGGDARAHGLVGSGECCSSRHKISCSSRCEGSTCVSMTWRGKGLVDDAHRVMGTPSN